MAFRVWTGFTVAIVFTVQLNFISTVCGQEFQTLLDRIEAQDQRIRLLEDSQIYLNASRNHSSLVMGGGDDGWEDVSGEKWSHKIGGRVMWDYVNFANVDLSGPPQGFAEDPEDYWEFRRMRLFVSGKGYGVYEYKIQLDFEPEGSRSDSQDEQFSDKSDNDKDSGVSMKDVYIGITDLCFLNHVRFGHQKEAFSLEGWASSKYITFMERALPSQGFVPFRNVGIQFFNHTPDEAIAWQFGAFFSPSTDDVDEMNHERLDDNQGIDCVARVCGTPYYCDGGRTLMHVGAGAYYRDDNDGVVRFLARPETHEDDRMVDSGNLVLDSYWVYNLEAALVRGPLSVQGEFFHANLEGSGLAGVTDQGAFVAADATRAGEFDFYGAYVYVSYFLTGENREYDRYYGRFKRIKPHTNFWWVPTGDCGCCSGCGAWELAARWSYYDISDLDVSESGEMNNYTLGVNWYLNPYTRLMFNYIHADTGYTNGDTADADILAMRVQWDF